MKFLVVYIMASQPDIEWAAVSEHESAEGAFEHYSTSVDVIRVTVYEFDNLTAIISRKKKVVWI